MTEEQRERARAMDRAYKQTPKAKAKRKEYLSTYVMSDAAREAKRQLNKRYPMSEATREKRRAYERARHYRLAALAVKVAPIHAAALERNAIWVAANAAVSRSIPADVRDDVISMIVLAVLEREISVKDIPHVCREFTSRHYRQFSKFDTVSLDAPIFDDSGLTLMDRLTTENAVLL